MVILCWLESDGPVVYTQELICWIICYNLTYFKMSQEQQLLHNFQQCIHFHNI